MSLNLRKTQTRRAVALVLVLLFLALGVYQIRGANGLMALHRRRQEEREWQERNETLRRQNEELEKRVHELRTDPKAIEKIAREELMLASPGEKVLLAPQKK